MKEIIKKWCKTNDLNLEDASVLITEYCSIMNKSISSKQLQMLFQINNQMLPIDWEYIIEQICNKYNWSLVKLLSAPNEKNQIQILSYYLNE